MILVGHLWVRLLLFLISAAVSIRLLSLKTVAEEDFRQHYCGKTAKKGETS